MRRVQVWKQDELYAVSPGPQGGALAPMSKDEVVVYLEQHVSPLRAAAILACADAGWQVTYDHIDTNLSAVPPDLTQPIEVPK